MKLGYLAALESQGSAGLTHLADRLKCDANQPRLGLMPRAVQLWIGDFEGPALADRQCVLRAERLSIMDGAERLESQHGPFPDSGRESGESTVTPVCSHPA